MSLVGPRPMPVKYLPRFNEQQLARLSLKPGITGLAQIKKEGIKYPGKSVLILI